ncbi:hypothetical protein B0H14DRAFT_2690961 [Mycena olivaceomarginata]|nr:hypothetical protein B0H14DRAFT_2690961 [Mycena olivaceomarginata]
MGSDRSKFVSVFWGSVVSLFSATQTLTVITWSYSTIASAGAYTWAKTCIGVLNMPHSFHHPVWQTSGILTVSHS